MSSEEKFATAINCMDGRSIRAVLQYFEDTFGILYVDTPSDAGSVKCCDGDDKTLEAVRFKVVEVSIKKHGSKHVAIVAHDECAGNPISRDEQIEQIERYIDIVHSWLSEEGINDVKVFGLWSYRRGTTWVAEPVLETAEAV